MDLVLYEVSKKAWIFKTRGRGSLGRSFIFDAKHLPQKPEPQKIVIERTIGKYKQRFTMSWKKFLGETAIGDIICIDWNHFKKSVT
jgi:hypothetical protein